MACGGRTILRGRQEENEARDAGCCGEGDATVAIRGEVVAIVSIRVGRVIVVRTLVVEGESSEDRGADGGRRGDPGGAEGDGVARGRRGGGSRRLAGGGPDDGVAGGGGAEGDGGAGEAAPGADTAAVGEVIEGSASAADAADSGVTRARAIRNERVSIRVFTGASISGARASYSPIHADDDLAAAGRRGSCRPV